MLLFNLGCTCWSINKKHISIHLMLLFNSTVLNDCRRQARFQYILCCCLTKEHDRTATAYKKFQYILCCCLTCLALLVLSLLLSFQYILCCCLTNAFKPFLKVFLFPMPLFYTIYQKITSNFYYFSSHFKNHLNQAYLLTLCHFFYFFSW